MMPLDNALRFLASMCQEDRPQTVTGEPIQVEIKASFDYEDAMFTASVVHVYPDSSTSEQFWYSAPTLAGALQGLVREMIVEAKR